MARPEAAAGSILQRVLNLAAERPDAIALRRWWVDAEPEPEAVSRAELVRLAATIARSIGAGGDGPIGLCFCGTTCGAVAALLAARMLDRMYLPLDASAQAPERMAQLCAAAGCVSLVCDDGCATLAATVSRSSGGVTVVNADRVDSCASDDAVESMVPRHAAGIARSALYLMYTSGSTGTPKGVAGTETGAVNRCDWQAATFPWQATDVALARTSLGFVDHVAEIFAPLIAGVPIVVQARAAGKSPWREPAVLLRTIRECGISRLVVVPSLLRELLRLGALRETAPSLQYLHCSGEPLQVALAERVLEAASDKLRLLNLYGSTECAADVTCQVLARGDSTREETSSSLVPVGFDLSGCRSLLLVETQDEGRWSETDEVGEVFVAGAHLADGYYRNPQATAEAFIFLRQVGERDWAIVPSTGGAGGERFFRTGDKGVWAAAGVAGSQRRALHLLGRDDQQIKIRGVRVNLVEVEAALRAIERIADAVVCHVAGSIVAMVIVVMEDDDTPSSSSAVYERASCERELMQECSARLLAAAVPTQIWTLSTDLPRLPNGKTDRRSAHSTLSSLCGPPLCAAARDEAQSTPEEALRLEGHLPCTMPSSNADRLQQWSGYIQALFAQQLGLQNDRQVTKDDNFFSCGGDSLKAVRMLSELSNEARRQGLWEDAAAPPLLAGFERDPTPHALAKLVLFSTAAATAAAATPEVEQLGIDIVPLVEADVNELASLVAREFCRREPMMASLELSRSQERTFEVSAQSNCTILSDPRFLKPHVP
jgi:non-ribosomal peptide synthetase component F|eukprot:COSAG06_NODE_47_length_29196_cov_53.194178_20_plen_773_part_00